jgi:hypothetical protein
MALMDELMKKTEDGLKTLKETAEGIAFSVEKQTKIAKRKMDIMKIQRKLQRVYGEVGEYAYGEYAMDRPVTMDAPFLKDRMIAISQMKSEMREIEDDIEVIRKTQQPKHEEPPSPEEGKA